MSKSTAPIISVIIVNYQVTEQLIACIRSIITSKPKTTFEIIVVDNDEQKTLHKKLKIKYPQVTYIANENNGFGEGINRGVTKAKGKYLFILNPDTLFLNNCLDLLYSFIDTHKNVSIVAPLLIDMKNKPFVKQGGRNLTPFWQILEFSSISSLLPRIIRNMYWLLPWDYSRPKKVVVVPGTAFLIKKKTFQELGGFDEKFFLYYEEFDLCKRIHDSGGEAYIIPTAKLKHAWGLSTKQRNDINKIFITSRLYYFRKHFGLVNAYLLEFFLTITKYSIFLLVSIVLGIFLSLYRISDMMPFIGDYGWFYLSARDMVVQGQIPLVGIPSSHPWLHQGAYWTYLLALGMKLFSFNPLSGVYMSITFFAVTILLLYRFGAEMFNKSTGVVASLLYSVSPLVIFTARSPYHTSIIPFFSLLFFYFLFKWTQGNKYYLPFIIGTLGILYNFEIATVLFSFVLVSFCLYGIYKKASWLRQSITRKNIIYSFIAYLTSMTPMLVYDFQHHFPQTLGFISWMGYRFLLLFGYPPLHPEIPVTQSQNIFEFFSQNLQKYIFIADAYISLALFVISLGYTLFLFRTKKKRNYSLAHSILVLILTVCLSGIIIMKTSSDAYLPMLFPVLIFLFAITFSALLSHAKLKFLGFMVVLTIVAANIYSLLANEYYTVKGGRFSDKIAIISNLVKDANGREYNLIGRGPGSQFESFTMHYQYLAWWMGNEPITKSVKLQYVIDESRKDIMLKKNL